MNECSVKNTSNNSNHNPQKIQVIFQLINRTERLLKHITNVIQLPFSPLSKALEGAGIRCKGGDTCRGHTMWLFLKDNAVPNTQWLKLHYSKNTWKQFLSNRAFFIFCFLNRLLQNLSLKIHMHIHRNKMQKHSLVTTVSSVTIYKKLKKSNCRSTHQINQFYY